MLPGLRCPPTHSIYLPRPWRCGVAIRLADIPELAGHPALIALADEFLTVAQQYADLCHELGEHDRAVPPLRDQAAAHPLHEPVHVRLITALAATGRQADALNAYDSLRRRLAHDLGIDPGAELADLHRRILRQEITVPSGPRDAGPAAVNGCTRPRNCPPTSRFHRPPT